MPLRGMGTTSYHLKQCWPNRFSSLMRVKYRLFKHFVLSLIHRRSLLICIFAKYGATKGCSTTGHLTYKMITSSLSRIYVIGYGHRTRCSDKRYGVRCTCTPSLTTDCGCGLTDRSDSAYGKRRRILHCILFRNDKHLFENS